MDRRNSIHSRTLQSLRLAVRGRVVTPEDREYDAARRVWNGRFDRRPAAIAYCTGTEDIAGAVNVAREAGLLVAVRSGGHDYAGNSICDGGLVIDLSAIDAVSIDPERRAARVGAGAKWSAVDRGAQSHGLATPGGTVSSVGVAGFTLGGGSGWLSRKHGLALDNLLAAELVLADGSSLRASADENPDLFWGLRGGGGNFGIVTSFELRLHALDSEVLAGQILHPLGGAREVLRACRSILPGAPDEVQCFPFFIRIPPLDAFPRQYHGQVVLDMVVAYGGDPSRGAEALSSLRKLGSPFMSTVATQSYLDLQRTFDAGMLPGNRWYSKAHYLRELSDDAIDTLIENVQEMPGALTMVYLEPPGGAIARVDREATAFPHRDCVYGLHILAGWTDASDDSRMMAWARRFHAAMSRFATGGAYVNLLGGDEVDGAAVAYGSNLARLAALKRRYDPRNLFRSNHNIPPQQA